MIYKFLSRENETLSEIPNMEVSSEDIDFRAASELFSIIEFKNILLNV